MAKCKKTVLTLLVVMETLLISCDLQINDHTTGTQLPLSSSIFPQDHYSESASRSDQIATDEQLELPPVRHHTDRRALPSLTDLLPKAQKVNTSVRKRGRRSATLVWPTGSTFVAEFFFIIPITAPTGVKIPFTIDVPYKFTLPNITAADLFGGRGKQKKHDSRDRLDIYGVVEGLFSKFGVDGKACVLRAICEKTQLDLVNGGILGEFIAAILSASSSGYSDEMYEYHLAEYYGNTNADCRSTYPSCPMSLFQWLD
ncbi:uncharacterized protein [Palaemon carinicauda]|uniref:uncharacterized protein n=1 Tax=Palaemon carinicauda TaxID=392227 RepID=UPI0035B5C2F6